MRARGDQVPTPRRTRCVRPAALAVAVLAGLLPVLAAPPPATAGTLGLTVRIQGAGLVQAVEGGAYSCTLTNGYDERASSSCARLSITAVFEAWVWLRATPNALPERNWLFAGWTGCDTTRVVEGVTECGVHSGAFSLDERSPQAVFTDVLAPSLVAPSFATRYGTSSVPVSFSTSDPTASFRCSIDAAPAFTPCTPGSYTFADGAHTFRVLAQDPSGQTSATSVSTFVIDLRAPTTTITSAPPPYSSSRAATFSYRADEPATFTCTLDGNRVTCASGTSYLGLADGSHTFAVVADDGFRAGAPATHTWTVDTTAPDTTMTAGPTSTTDRTPTFQFAAVPAEDVTRYECRLDAGEWSACSGPGATHTTGALGLGPHVLVVRAVDRAGNVDASPASRSFTVRAPVPDTRFTAGPAGRTADRTPTFRFTTTVAGSSFQCRVDSRTWRACRSPWTLTTLTLGAHTVAVRARTSGGTDPSPAVRRITVVRR